MKRQGGEGTGITVHLYIVRAQHHRVNKKQRNKWRNEREHDFMKTGP